MQSQSNIQQHIQPPRSVLPPQFLQIKPGQLSTVFAVSLVVASFYLQMPAYVFYPLLLIGMLGLLTFSNYTTLLNSFTEEGAPRSIPANFASKMAELEADANQMRQLGFEELDRHYIKRNFDGLRIVLSHQQRPIYWNLTHFVKRLTYSELFTAFEDGSFLSTTSVSSGNMPLAEGIYMQCLERAQPSQLLEAHQDALEILMQYGYVPVNCITEQDALRSFGRDVERQVVSHVTTVPLWPLKMTFWVLFKAGRKYCVPLREQIANNATKILPVQG